MQVQTLPLEGQMILRARCFFFKNPLEHLFPSSWYPASTPPETHLPNESNDRKAFQEHWSALQKSLPGRLTNGQVYWEFNLPINAAQQKLWIWHRKNRFLLLGDDPAVTKLYPRSFPRSVTIPTNRSFQGHFTPQKGHQAAELPGR